MKKKPVQALLATIPREFVHILDTQLLKDLSSQTKWIITPAVRLENRRMKRELTKTKKTLRALEEEKDTESRMIHIEARGRAMALEELLRRNKIIVAWAENPKMIFRNEEAFATHYRPLFHDALKFEEPRLKIRSANIERQLKVMYKQRLINLEKDQSLPAVV